MPKQTSSVATPSAATDADLSFPTPDVHQGSNESVSPSTHPVEVQLRAADLELGSPSPDQCDDARETRIRSIADAAYLRRGGEPGDEVQDWLEAERTVDAEGMGKQPPG